MVFLRWTRHLASSVALHLAIPYAAVAVTCLGCVWLIASQPSATPQPEQSDVHQQDSQGSPSPSFATSEGQPSANQHSAFDDLLNKARRDPIAWLTLGILVVTGFQTRFNYLLTTHNKTIERAYVVVTPEPPGLKLDDYTETREDGVARRRVELTIQIKNIGNTPARITDVAATPWLGLLAPAIPPVPKRGKGEHAFLTTADAFESEWLWLLDAKEIEDSILYVFGFVDYIDKFNQRHRLGFARWFNPALDQQRFYMRTPRPASGLGVVTMRERLQRSFGELDADAYDSRNNLLNFAQAGYNYDRLRRRGEGSDWEE